VQAEATKSSVAPVLDGSSPSPEKTESPVDKTTADESPTISPPAARDDNRRAEARQAMEAEFEKLIAEYERMIRGESSPADAVNQQISDLKRSIESSPNRSDSYLELGRAYEKAGEDKKAAEVYRQARNRFPKDKRFQRTLKKGSRTRRGSESDRNRRKITKLTNRKARVVIEYVFNPISAR
jgi:tetratricopeptide (TPR) repeat protein